MVNSNVITAEELIRPEQMTQKNILKQIDKKRLYNYVERVVREIASINPGLRENLHPSLEDDLCKMLETLDSWKIRLVTENN